MAGTSAHVEPSSLLYSHLRRVGSAGSSQASATWPSPAVAVRPVGFGGSTGDDRHGVAGPAPAALTARSWKE